MPSLWQLLSLVMSKAYLMPLWLSWMSCKRLKNILEKHWIQQKLFRKELEVLVVPKLEGSTMFRY